MGLHNLTTDDWAEQISPSVFDENAVDDEENEEYLTEEEQRIQREKINLDLKRLEKFLDEFDYFSGKSQLDRHKLRFHADYLKARAIYYDNIMVFPPEIKTPAEENTASADNEETKGTTQSESTNQQDEQNAAAIASQASNDDGGRYKQKIKEDAKSDQLMELFYRVYDELQKLQA